MDIVYVVLGFILIVFEALNSLWTSLARSVGGEGILASLITAFIALAIAGHARDRANEAAKKAVESEERVTKAIEDLKVKLAELRRDLEAKLTELEMESEERLAALEEKLTELEDEEDDLA